MQVNDEGCENGVGAVSRSASVNGSPGYPLYLRFTAVPLLSRSPWAGGSWCSSYGAAKPPHAKLIKRNVIKYWLVTRSPRFCKGWFITLSNRNI